MQALEMYKPNTVDFFAAAQTPFCYVVLKHQLPVAGNRYAARAQDIADEALAAYRKLGGGS